MVASPWVRRFREFLAGLWVPAGPGGRRLLSLRGIRAPPEQGRRQSANTSDSPLNPKNYRYRQLTLGPVTPLAPASPGTP